MKKLLFIFILLLTFPCVINCQDIYDSHKGQAVNIASIREDYRTANKDSLSCAKLYKKVSVENNSTLFKGYKGAVTMMYAGFVKDKAEKLRLFKAGKVMLEEAITKEKENPELILLRFTIQSNAPKVLGYNKEIESDKKFLLEKYKTIERKEIRMSIKQFLSESKLLTPEEKATLK